MTCEIKFIVKSQVYTVSIFHFHAMQPIFGSDIVQTNTIYYPGGLQFMQSLDFKNKLKLSDFFCRSMIIANAGFTLKFSEIQFLVNFKNL